MHKWSDLKKQKFTPEEITAQAAEAEQLAAQLLRQDIIQVRTRLQGRGVDDRRWTDEQIAARLTAEDMTTGAVAEDLAILAEVISLQEGGQAPSAEEALKVATEVQEVRDMLLERTPYRRWPVAEIASLLWRGSTPAAVADYLAGPPSKDSGRAS